MLSLHLISLLIFSTYCQSIIRVGIIDDNDNPKGLVHINVPNITFCDRQGFNLQLHWINTLNSLPNLLNKLELDDENQTKIYLTYTEQFSTKLIRDFCQKNHIPFFNIKSDENKTILCSLTSSLNEEYILLPNILQVLINYFKYNHIQNAVYIYDNDQSNYRIYQLLELMNNEEYFNSFSLDIRIINDDIYSLLYSIEANSFQKNKLLNYILLDLYSYDQYEKIFEQISHMGLTSNNYHYIILSTFDACLWINKLNFTGQIIYFDYQQRDCIYNQSPSSNIKNNSSLSVNIKHEKSYYRSSLSFRIDDSESSKSLNSIEYSSTNVSLTNLTLNSCYNKMKTNHEYFSFTSLHSQLSKSSQLYSHSLFNFLNLIIRILTLNLLDCKTYRFKPMKTTNTNHCHYADINIYSTKKSSSNQFKQQIKLIGRYSTMNNHYQSCQLEKMKNLSVLEEPISSRTYYITSLFDEPFLMLRKRTSLHAKYNHPEADLNELRGRIFHFHELEGFCVDLAEQICSILNITCRFRIVEDGNFGSKNSSTGIWDGMVGEIVSRKADMAIGPLTISHERMEVVDFSKPFMNLGISIMISKPDKQKPGVFSFMNPVSMEIWLCLSLAYIAVSVVLFLTSRVVNSGWRRRVVRRPSYRSFSYPKSVNDRRKSEIQLQRQKQDSMISVQSNEFPIPIRPSIRRRYHYRPRPLPPQNARDSNSDKNKEEEYEKSSVHLFGISNALFFSFSSFMRQSINLVPKSLSGRVAATSWWYFSLIFVSSYTANLVAFLTVEKLVTPIESVEDLAKQHEIKYGLIRNGTTAAFFEKSNVTLFQHMWMIMQESSSDVLVATNDEAVAKVRSSKGKYAVFIESTKNEYVDERLPCDTMKVGSDLDSKGYGVATRLGSSLTEAINMIITNLRESGFVDKLKQRWWYDRSECSQATKDKRFSELSLSSVTGLFYIFLFGIILSCIIAFTEFIITAKNESETLKIDFREILRIKMIENMIGITINTQRQLESGSGENECDYQYHNEENEIIKHYTVYQLQKTQSDV